MKRTKRVKPRASAVVALVDRAGRPVLAWCTATGPDAHRTIANYARRCVRRVVVWGATPLIHDQLVHRALVQFADTTEWIEARDVFAAGGVVPITRALTTMSTRAWWVGANGALERCATLYEESAGSRVPPPVDGWTLVSAETVASLVAYSKQTVGERAASVTEEQARVVERLRRHKRVVADAVAQLAKHERQLERKTRVVAYWRARVTTLRATAIADAATDATACDDKTR